MGPEVSRGVKCRKLDEAQTKRAARLGSRLVGHRIAENSASVCAHGVGSRVGVGYMIGLRYAGGRDGRAARAVAARRFLGAATTLSEAFGVARGFTKCLVLSEPAVFELGLRIGVPIRLR